MIPEEIVVKWNKKISKSIANGTEKAQSVTDLANQSLEMGKAIGMLEMMADLKKLKLIRGKWVSEGSARNECRWKYYFRRHPGSKGKI